MKIRHSKYKNTGLIFELLVKQITADILKEKKDSPATAILKQFYTGRTPLVREFKLYDFVLKNRKISQNRAETVLSTILEVSKSLNEDTLKKQKYNLVKEIKEHYDLDEFFSIKVKDYKPLAALYTLLEAYKASDLIDPEVLIDNKFTLLEHLTSTEQDKEEVKDTLIEEYSKYDKDLKLLTFRILLEKFNNKHNNLLPEQKHILREFIISVNSSTRLRNTVNEEMEKIGKAVRELKGKVKDNIVEIKLNEILKMIKPVEKTKKITDNHLINIMQYYELIEELKKL